MTYAADPRVDAYIDALPEWQQAICREVRELVHATDAEVTETIKRTNRPYFVLQGDICALLAAKDHVNVFLYDGAIVPDPEGIITGGHDNKTARTVALYQGEEVNRRALSAMFSQIIENNRAGGWRKLKRQSSVDHSGSDLNMSANPIDTYLADVPSEQRSVLEALRERIRAIVPDGEEVISYGLPAFRVDGKVFIGFKANKNDYSIYPFSGGAAERFTEELQGRTVTSGSIHFTPNDPISDDLLRRIIQWRIGAHDSSSD